MADVVRRVWVVAKCGVGLGLGEPWDVVVRWRGCLSVGARRFGGVAGAGGYGPKLTFNLPIGHSDFPAQSGLLCPAQRITSGVGAELDLSYHIYCLQHQVA